MKVCNKDKNGGKFKHVICGLCLSQVHVVLLYKNCDLLMSFGRHIDCDTYTDKNFKNLKMTKHLLYYKAVTCRYWRISCIVAPWATAIAHVNTR